MRHLLHILLVSSVATASPPARAPLLEEGSFLARVPGTLEPAIGGGAWGFRLHGQFEGDGERVIALLPSAALEDMVGRHASLAPGQQARFELSARVTTYRGMNAALPVFATPIAELPARGARIALRPPGAAIAAPAPESEPATIARDDHPPEGPLEAFGIRWVPLLPQARDSAARVTTELRADDIEQSLMDRVGEARRSADRAADDRQQDQDRLSTMASSGALDPVTGRPWLEPARTVQDRLGVVTRDPVTGEWRFVFESSRGELGEREATLLPCALLERIERLARSTQGPLTLVLSGQVTRFEGRAYLLPTHAGAATAGRLLSR
jgi:hypothetical protein